MNRDSSRTVVGGAAIISVFALAGKGLGFLQKLVMAYFFGTSGVADAFALAYNSLIMVIGQFPQQILSPFLPVYMEVRRNRGEAAARRLAGMVGTLLASGLVVTVLGGLLLAPRLIGWISQFSSEETFGMAVRLVRLMMPAVLFLGLIAYGTLLLHAEKRFSRPALAETLNKLVVICTLLLLGSWLGIRALGLGVVLGAMLAFLIVALGLGGRWAFPGDIGRCFRDPDLLRWLALTGPIVAGVVVAQIRTVLDNRFASAMATGSVAGLQYARGLTDTLVLLIPSAVGVAIYPVFSEMAEPAQRRALGFAVLGAFRAMIVLLLPVSLLLIVLRVPVIQLLFQRGKFNAESVMMTSWPLVFYGAGLPIFALEILLMRFYYALKNTWIPTVVGAACVVLHVLIILMCRGTLQHGSMALAATVSKAVKVGILWIGLRAFLPSLEGGRTLRFAGQCLFALLGMGLGVWLVRVAWEAVLAGGLRGGVIPRVVWLGAEIGAAGGIGVVIYFLLGWVVGIEEISRVVGWLVRRLSFCSKEEP